MAAAATAAAATTGGIAGGPRPPSGDGASSPHTPKAPWNSSHPLHQAHKYMSNPGEAKYASNPAEAKYPSNLTESATPRLSDSVHQAKYASNPAEAKYPSNLTEFDRICEQAVSSTHPPTTTSHHGQMSRQASREVSADGVSNGYAVTVPPLPIISHLAPLSKEMLIEVLTPIEGVSGAQQSAASSLQQVSVQAMAPEVINEFVAAFRSDMASMMLVLKNHLVEELKDLKNQGEGPDRLRTASASGNLPMSARAFGPTASMSGTEKRTAFANGDPERAPVDMLGAQAASAAGTGAAATVDEATTQLAASMMDAPPMRMEIGMATPLVDPSWSWGSLSGQAGPGPSQGYHLTPQCDAIDEPANQPASFQDDETDAGGLTFHEKLKRAQEAMRAEKGESSWVVTVVTSFLEDPESSRAAFYYSQFMTAFSIFSILVGMSPYTGLAVPLYVEVVVDAILSLEIVVRGLFCPDLKVFLSNYANLVDAMSLAPLTVILLMQCGLYDEELGHAFLLSAVPVIRLLRFSRRFPKMQILITAFKDCLEALPVLLYTLAVMGCVFTSAVFLVEPRDNIATLPESAWLVIATISTVGYGDVTPCTKFGAALASVLMVVSQLYMAMPFGIIGYNFTVIWERRTQIMLINGTRDRLAKLGFGAYEIPRLFELFDLDENAEFDMEEFQVFFKELEIGFNEHDVVELFKLIDKDISGTIDEREFVKAVYPEEYREMYARHTVKHPSKEEAPIDGRATQDVREVW